MAADYILAINPGATSTKIAVFRNNQSVFLKSIRHECEDLESYEQTCDQLSYRLDLVLAEIKDNHIPHDQVGMIIARGGLIYPLESGIYEVNETMIRDLSNGVMGDHASNLGGLIAHRLQDTFTRASAFIADPVVVDELDEVARISGHPQFERTSIFHALNQKSVARMHAQSVGKEYEDMNLVVAHLGSGISVGAHRKGRVVDVNNALDGEGPFGPERSGTLPNGALARFCLEEGRSWKEVRKMLTGEGGMYAYLGHKDAQVLEKMANEGDAHSTLIHKAMAYQVSKEIGAMAVALSGQVDGILITGGMAHNPGFTEAIKERIEFMAPVFIYPGEDEMRALAHNGSLLLSGKVSAKQYIGKKSGT
jgi:butyrate kinase